MADNTIIIDFKPCEPTPANGYVISYRPANSSGPYRVWPVNFFTSPIEFTDTNDPVGTDYEGFIQGDCGGGKLGVPVPWFAQNGSIDSSSGSASESVSESESVEESTLSWFMNDQLGANLTIVRVSNSAEYLDEDSEIVPKDGVLNLPGGTYNITASWISGSLNTIHFRVCSLAEGELHYNNSITIGESDTYVLSVSEANGPYTVYVYAGNEVPPACPVP